MKLLVFYPYIPYPTNRGAYHRTYYLLRELAREHEVDFMGLAEGCEGMGYRDAFASFCGRVEFVPFEHPAWEKLFPTRLLNRWPATISHWNVEAVRRALDDLLGCGDYDAVHICDIVLAQYFLRTHRGIPLIVDRTRVDLYYQFMEQQRMAGGFRTRLLSCENLVKLWWFERAVAERAEFEVVCGPDDAAVVRRFVSKRVPLHVLPNGVDLDYFRAEVGGSSERSVVPSLLFC